MNNRFTEQAQQAIQHAHEILQEKQHTQLDNEHILLALLTQQDSTVARILQQMKVDSQSLAAEVDKALGNIPHSYGSNYSGGLQIYITMRVKRLFEVAAEEADRLNDNFISTEHLFLAIADERTGASARLLQQFGVDKDKIYATLKEVRGDEPVPASKSSATRWSSNLGADSDDATKQILGWLSRILTMEQEIASLRDDVRRLHDVPAGLTMLKQQVAGLREQMQSLEGKVDELLKLVKGEHDDQP